MNTFFRHIFSIASLLTVVCCSTFAQTPSITEDESIENLFARVDAALESAEDDELPVLSPRLYRNALEARSEATSLRQKGEDERLIKIKLKGALEDLEAAKRNAETTRSLLGNLLAERKAAENAGAESSAHWQPIEDKLTSLIRDIEQNRTANISARADTLAGEYRATRRDALRNQLLGEARLKLNEVEAQNGENLVPKLFLRAQQALTRAESAIAQENIETAREAATESIRESNHALALINYMSNFSSERYPWESALLPYDRLLEDIAEFFGMDLDFSRGGVAVGEELKHRIRAYMDSLATTTQTRESLESQLGSAQTELADAHNRIMEMEKRIADLERDRASAQSDLSKRQVIAERLRVAQSFFEPADATVLLDEEGRVVIRVYGIRFASGATTLTKSQQKQVETLAKAIQTFPEAMITVEGHTDSDGSEDSNQKLSEKRASSVGKLLEKTLPVSYSPPKIVGYGESKPIADNKSSSGRAQNRRIDVILEIP